jgi:hypothetical protein
MRYVLITFWFLIATDCFAQQMPDIDLYKVRLTEADRTLVFEVKPTKDQDTQTDRTYHWYGSRLIHTTQGGYSGKLLNGAYSEFYISKGLRKKGSFKNGLKTGNWEEWTEAGTLLSSTEWKKGIEHGTFMIFDDKGAKTKEGKYREGRLNGPVMVYHGQASPEVLNYNDGQIVKPVVPNKRSFWYRLVHFKFKKKKQ